MRKIFIVSFIIISLLTTACTNSDMNSNASSADTSMAVSSIGTSDNSTASEANPMKITAQEAKTRLDADKGIIILDVRTKEEFVEKHIPGALLLPVDTIADKASTVIPEKTKTYFIYCRSGNRSATAAAQLVSMGYTSIYDFGGIIDWPYETVTGE
jgi:rhodanese-related sulfurtransferase